MADAAAPRPWLRRIGEFVLALLLLAFALWVIIAGHFWATCGGASDWLGWSALTLASLPIREHWVVVAWLGMGIGLTSTRPLSTTRRFRMVFAAVIVAGLALAVVLGVTEHLLGLRSRCSLGGW